MIKWNFGGNRDLALKYRGEGVRLLAQLKMGMQPFISRLFPDGTEIQVVRGPINDIVSITSPIVEREKEAEAKEDLHLIFLMNKPDEPAGYISDTFNSYVVLRVVGGKLMPYRYNIHDTAKLVLTGPADMNPSTLINNYDYTEYLCHIETLHAIRYYTLISKVCGEDQYAAFGKYIRVTNLCTSEDIWVFKGTASQYAPVDENNYGGVPTTFWTQIWYLTNSSDVFVCWTRNPYVKLPEINWVKYLSMWSNIEIYPYVMPAYCLDLDGYRSHEKLFYDESNTKTCTSGNVFAIIGQDKIIGKEDGTLVPYSESTIFSWTLGSCGGTFMPLFLAGDKSTTPWKFGNVELEDDYGSYFIESTITYPSYYGPVCPWDGVPPPIDPLQLPVSIFTGFTAMDQKIYVYDYDNLGEDEIFITFYGRYRGNGSGRHNYMGVIAGITYLTVDETGETSAIGPGGSFNGYDQEGVMMDFIMAYKLPGKDLVKIEICRLGNYTRNWEKGDLTHCVRRNVTGCAWYAWISYEWSKIGMYGWRAVRFSSKVTRRYIFYTYIIQTYIGPAGETHFDDTDDNENWEFLKRVVGCITVSTGVREEYEITDEWIGEDYAGRFDKTQPAGLGYHRVKGGLII